MASPANPTTSTDALFKALSDPAPDPQVVHAAIEEIRQLVGAGRNVIEATGAWVLHRADQDQELHKRLLQGLHEFLIHNRDRELFGLAPRRPPTIPNE